MKVARAAERSILHLTPRKYRHRESGSVKAARAAERNVLPLTPRKYRHKGTGGVKAAGIFRGKTERKTENPPRVVFGMERPWAAVF